MLCRTQGTRFTLALKNDRETATPRKTLFLQNQILKGLVIATKLSETHRPTLGHSFKTVGGRCDSIDVAVAIQTVSDSIVVATYGGRKYNFQLLWESYLWEC